MVYVLIYFFFRLDYLLANLHKEIELFRGTSCKTQTRDHEIGTDPGPRTSLEFLLTLFIHVSALLRSNL